MIEIPIAAKDGTKKDISSHLIMSDESKKALSLGAKARVS